MPSLAKLALKAVHEDNMAVVIGLQSTGEANIEQALSDMADAGEELEDFVSAPQMILKNLINRQFPTTTVAGVRDAQVWEQLYVHVYSIVRQWKQAPTVSV